MTVLHVLYLFVLAVLIGLPVYLLLGKYIGWPINRLTLRLVSWLLREKNDSCQVCIEDLLLKACWPFVLVALIAIVIVICLGWLIIGICKCSKLWGRAVKFAWHWK